MAQHLRSPLALALTIVAGIGGCDTDEPFSDDLRVKTERGRRGKADGELAPAAWDCAASYYGTDDGCDCGCGLIDPDCPDATLQSCIYCANEGSCSDDLCPGDIDPDNIATCTS